MSTIVDLYTGTMYPMNGITSLFDLDDLTYLQDHIKTFRALHTDEIDLVHGRYYEAAVSLIDAFGVFLTTDIGFNPTSSHVSIQSGESTKVSFKCNVGRNVYNGSHCDHIIHQYTIDMHYSAANIRNEYSGYYFITITNEADGDENMFADIGSVRLGNVLKVPTPQWENRMCIPVSPDALRYCECFPTPATFRSMIIDAWRTINKSDTWRSLKHE